MITVYGLHTEQNDFANCGLAVLHPTSAYITEELNGRYDLEIDVPCIHDDPHGDNDSWKYVRVYNILKASNGQLFQINKVQYYTKSGVPYVKAYAPHIWYYLSDMCVFHAESYTEAYWAMVDLFKDRALDPDNGTTWFSHGTGLTDYNFDWSIVGAGERYYKFDYTSLANAILGNSDSICNLWGLEIHRDNFRFSLRPRKEGTSDGAFYLKYGINCTDVKFTYDSSTRKTELHMHDNGGDTAAISYDPSSGLFPHQAISGAYMTYENPSIELLRQDRGIYWDEVSQIKSTWEVNYVDFHLTDHETGYERPLKVGDAGTVEGVDKIDLAIGTAVTDVAAASLVVTGVGNGGNFLVAVHGGDQDLNVVGAGHGGGAVAGGQLHGTEMEAQTLYQLLSLGDQLVECLVGGFGSGELEHFHLVELVATNHATLVSTVRTGLTAEAGGVSEELLGQVSLGQNLVTVDGCQSSFCGGQHVEGAAFGGVVGNLEDFVSKLGELTGSQTALVLQHVGRQDQLVAVCQVGIDKVI